MCDQNPDYYFKRMTLDITVYFFSRTFRSIISASQLIDKHIQGCHFATKYRYTKNVTEVFEEK